MGLSERQLQLRQRWHDFFKEWDAALLPTLPTAATPHAHSTPATERTIEVNGAPRSYFKHTLRVVLTGLAWLPAALVPGGLTLEGRPTEVQIAGPFQGDRSTLALGGHVERILGGFRRPPGY